MRGKLFSVQLKKETSLKYSYPTWFWPQNWWAVIRRDLQSQCLNKQYLDKCNFEYFEYSFYTYFKLGNNLFIYLKIGKEVVNSKIVEAKTIAWLV